MTILSDKSNYESLLKNGIQSAKLGKFKESENYFIKAINQNKNKPDAYINLANILILQKRNTKSFKILHNYISNNTTNYEVSNFAAKIFLNFNAQNEFIKLCKILNINKNKNHKENSFIHFVEGQFYERNKNFSKAKNSYFLSISCNEIFFEPYFKLFNIFEKTNQLQDLEKLIIKTEKIFNQEENKNKINLYKSILLNRKNNFLDSQEYIKTNRLYEKFKNDDNFLIQLLDLESKNNERLNKYSYSFRNILERNKLIINKPENKKYQNRNMDNNFQKYKKFYFKKNVQLITKKLKYLSDDQIVFLVGFPRSGTTLLDSILRSHSQIKVIEEKPYLLDLRHKFFESKKNNLSALLKITQKEKDEIRNNYINHAMTNMEGKKIIIDKFPLLITEIGFINCIFPNAKIIFAVRHPCDVVISCFFTSFKINEAMVKFLDWQNTIDFYNNVLDLFVFYENELDLKYKIIKYEDVVQNFKYQITKLVEFLDLKYEKNLEKFYETAKNRSQIFTPSYTQVVNPLYTSSINRWKNYDQSKFLSTSLSKWIEKFNY